MPLFDMIKKALRQPGRAHEHLLKKIGWSHLSNLEYNRRLWDRYAKTWKGKTTHVEDTTIVSEDERRSGIQYLGDEWGASPDVDRVLADFLYPLLAKQGVTAEIGSGGGRIALRVVERVKELHCFDISREMLRRAKAALAPYPHVSFTHLRTPWDLREYAGRFDVVYSFDVFVHLDVHTMWKYFQVIQEMLKPDGKAFLHTSNLKAPAGWKYFASQQAYSVEEHYFVSPEIVEVLAAHSGLKILKRSTPDPSSYYLNRDFLVVLGK